MNATTRRKSTTTPSSVSASAKKDATRAKIERMELEREERRREMIQRKQARKKEHEDNVAKGNPGDIDFIGMVSEWRRKNIPATAQQQQQLTEVVAASNPNTSNICIAVRKRPMSNKERERIDHDSVSVSPPKSVTIHSAKLKVDGITKYLTHSTFHFDHAFEEGSTTPQIYIATTLPLVDHVLKTRGRATVFCYGQTGSGKTYTMNGIQQILAYDLYGEQSNEELEIRVAFFELYGGFIQDLLHDRKRCKLLEDGKGEVNITGLTEVAAPTPEDFLQIIEQGNGSRTTHITEANDTSSRSHAICQVFLRDKSSGKLRGKLALVDLAGSERGSDTKSHNTQRRAESADINTSLLSLKECIRALGQKSTHVPYRGSKLTLILKDCFSPESKTTMITTVSPGASSADHSLNTLRYADRIKEQRSVAKKPSRGATNNKTRSSDMPSNERLGRIMSAMGLADQLEQDAINELLSQHDKTLSPTGLAVPTTMSADSQQSEPYEFFTPNPSFAAKADRFDEEDIITVPSVVSQDTAESEDCHAIASVPSNTSQATAATYYSSRQEPTMEEEEELRRTVQALFELEESLLNQHMSNIQENAEMLTQEGKLLHEVQSGGMSEDEMDDYAIQLAEYLDRKEVLIYKLQSKLVEFKKQLAKEQQLTQRVTRLTQY